MGKVAALLQESAEDLYDNAPCGYVTTLLDGTILKANKTLVDWVGKATADPAEGARFQDLLTPTCRNTYATEIVPLLMREGAVTSVALDMKRSQGGHFPVHIDSVFKLDSAGEPVLVCTTVFDVSDRRRAERELQYERTELEQSTRRSAILQQAAGEYVSATTVGGVAVLAMQTATHAFGASAASIWEVDEQSDELVRVWSTSGDRSATSDRMSRLADHPCAEAWRCRAVVAAWPDKHLIATPLLADKRVTGILVLSFHREHAFAGDEVDLLRSLGHQVGQAMERAELLRNQEVLSARLDLFEKLSRRLLAPVGFDATARMIVEEIAQSSLAERAVIARADWTEQGWTVAASAGPRSNGDEAPEISVRLTADQLTTLRAGGPVFDSTQSPWVVGLPLTAGTEVPAVLTVDVCHHNGFDDAERAFFTALGWQCSGAVERSRLREEGSERRKAADRFERSVEADPSQLSPLRRDLFAWLRSHSLEPREAETIVLACSEAVANAVVHGYGADLEGAVRVEVEIDMGTLEIRVHDDGHWQSPRRSSVPSEAEDGRGLEIIEILMDDMAVERGDGTTVVMRKHLRL